MKTILSLLCFFMVSSNCFTQVYKKASLEDYPNKELQVHPDQTLPILNLKWGDGKLFKTIKAPSLGCMGFVSYDKKYVFLQEKGNLYRITIADNTTLAIPFNRSTIPSSDNAYKQEMNMLLSCLNTSSTKSYIKSETYTDGAPTGPIEIFEADFSDKSVKKYLTINRTTEKFGVGSSIYNKYLVSADENGLVKLYDIETKEVFKEFKIDLPEDKIDGAKISLIVPVISNGFLHLNYSGNKQSGSSKDWVFRIEYDLIKNTTIKSSYLEGELINAKEVKSLNDDSKIDFWYIGKMNPLLPRPSAEKLTVFPEFIYKPGKSERKQWIQEYEVNKQKVLQTISNNPDRFYQLDFITKPEVIVSMKNEEYEYMNTEYLSMVKLRDSLTGVFNEAMRLYHETSMNPNERWTTIFYHDEECNNEAFRLKGMVFHVKYISDELLEFTMTGSTRKFNLTTYEFVEEEIDDDDF